jgi:mannosyltransferase OCH1-like enzyme
MERYEQQSAAAIATTSSFVYPDTWSYEEPKCDPLDSEWHCGCKKVVLANGSIQSGNIDYSLHKPRQNEGIPRVVHFLSRMFTEEEDSGEGKASHKAKASTSDASDRSWCGDVPCKYLSYMSNYTALFQRGWEFHLHCKDEVNYLLQKHSPSFLTIYNSLRADIQRSDAARYLILYYFGGLYTDMDVDPHVDVTPLLQSNPNSKLVLGTEAVMDWPSLREKMKDLAQDCARVRAIAPVVAGEEEEEEDPYSTSYQSQSSSLLAEVCTNCSLPIQRLSLGDLMGCIHPIRKGRPEVNIRVANYWMASVAGHSFWKDVLELVQRRSHLSLGEQYDVLYTTGPDVVSEIYNLYQQTGEADNNEQGGVLLLDYDNLMGLNEHFTFADKSAWRKQFEGAMCNDLGFC